MSIYSLLFKLKTQITILVLFTVKDTDHTTFFLS